MTVWPPTTIDAYAPPLDSNPAPQAVYIHVPFCIHRCGYCDFTLIARRDDLIPAYLAALRNELATLRSVYDVQSIFIGGGTPTYLSCEHLQELMSLVAEPFRPTANAEITMEANPDGLDETDWRCCRRWV